MQKLPSAVGSAAVASEASLSDWSTRGGRPIGLSRKYR